MRTRAMSTLMSSLCTGVLRMEKVKFGVPLSSVCLAYNDSLPAPLLILILKLNKEAPSKKDVFRAPGHQANMKKLIHVLQTGRLVNIEHFNIYTIASVLKKFLSKLPGGIFGPDVESRLFHIQQYWQDDSKRIREINRLVTSLPVVNQQLLVLLIGTFATIAAAADRERTGMSSEALGISVAPSFFHCCTSEGCKTAKMEDLQRYKAAISIMRFLIDSFGISNLFGHENYAYYARMTSRVLKVEDNWIAYRYPHDMLCEVAAAVVVAAHHHQHHGPSGRMVVGSNSVSGGMCQKSLSGESDDTVRMDEDHRTSNQEAEQTRSLSFLPQVHERQTQRMRERSQWFLQHMQQHHHQQQDIGHRRNSDR